MASGMKYRTQGQPLLGLDRSHKLSTFFRGEYGELRWLVRQRRVRRAQDHQSSNASLVAAEGVGNSGIFGPAKLPKREKFLPPAVTHALEEQGQMPEAFRVFIKNHGTEHEIGMAEKAGVADRPAVKDGTTFCRHDALWRRARVHCNHTHLNFVAVLDKPSQEVAVTWLILGNQDFFG